MGKAYQISNQNALYFLTFHVVGWTDIFSRKKYRDIVIDSFTYCRSNMDLEIFAYVIMTNHIHAILRSKTGKLSDTVRDFKKFTSKQILSEIKNNPKESRKKWLLMIFKYHAKFNKRVNEIDIYFKFFAFI